MIADPPVRADGRCHVCAKQRKPERSKKYAGLTAETDPFCSVECVRAYYGNPYPENLSRAPNPDLVSHRGRFGNGFTHGTRDGYRLCACDLCTAAVKGPKELAHE